MDEVDKIIIDSLRHLNCDIEEDVCKLKEFSPDMIVAAISLCLERMNKNLKLGKKLPASMSARIKFASNLAQEIKELGFKGDMGYQTILYCNEIEVRRVFMFLLERLPKESNISVTLEPTGYVPKIIKQIEESLKNSLDKNWLPSETLNYGIRYEQNCDIVYNLANSCPIDSVKLITSTTAEDAASYIPSITHQCSSRQLIPSLIFECNTNFVDAAKFKNPYLKPSVIGIQDSPEVLENILENPSSGEEFSNINEGNSTNQATNNSSASQENQTETLLNSIKEKKEFLLALQEKNKKYEKKLLEVKSKKAHNKDLLTDLEETVIIKNKTMVILSNDENKVKLQNLVQKAEKRFSDVKAKWNTVEKSLLDERKEVKSASNAQDSKNERIKLRNLKLTHNELLADYKQKCIMEKAFMENCRTVNHKNNRAAYTKRILEIVGNIKKQNKEIQKILSDTRQVQKDINNLTGQVDRSFTISDEIIFSNCKHDEASRKAYKFLAALREECNAILQAVTSIGQAEREFRNLEDQVEIEKSKDMARKLEKIQQDINEIKKEIQTLM